MSALWRYWVSPDFFLKLFEAGKCVEYDSYENINDYRYFAIEGENDEIETDPDNEEETIDREDSKGLPIMIIVPGLMECRILFDSFFSFDYCFAYCSLLLLLCKSWRRFRKRLKNFPSIVLRLRLFQRE